MRQGAGRKPHSSELEDDAGSQAKPSFCREPTALPWVTGSPPLLLGCPLRLCLPLAPTEDVFPCKDCGIWYRSERNLQAHLLYYCASRQSAGSPAAAATDEKPKETYPNERVCPFPQCRKSCPSASSLEIHMRSHSGEVPRPSPLSSATTRARPLSRATHMAVCSSCHTTQPPTGLPEHRWPPGWPAQARALARVLGDKGPRRQDLKNPPHTACIMGPQPGWGAGAGPSLSPVFQENVLSCV